MKTAVLTLDYQQGVLAMLPNSAGVVERGAKAVAHARKAGHLVIHVGIGFEPGYPEIPDDSGFAFIKTTGFFVKGTPSAEFASQIVKPKDLIVYKHRVSAFTQNDLQMILRAQGIKHLVLMGVATSGIVLSTLRQAYDLDYSCTVLRDACMDKDEEVHRILTEKVFVGQAKVMKVDDYINA